MSERIYQVVYQNDSIKINSYPGSDPLVLTPDKSGVIHLSYKDYTASNVIELKGSDVFPEELFDSAPDYSFIVLTESSEVSEPIGLYYKHVDPDTKKKSVIKLFDSSIFDLINHDDYVEVKIRYDYDDSHSKSLKLMKLVDGHFTKKDHKQLLQEVIDRSDFDYRPRWGVIGS